METITTGQATSSSNLTPLYIPLERNMFCSALPTYHPLPLCVSCKNYGSNTFIESTGKWKHVGDVGHCTVAGTFIFMSSEILLNE